MEQKIRDLYQNMGDIAAGYLIYQKRDNVLLTKNIIPQIQEFVLWFLEENRIQAEEELYQGMRENLLVILQDILTALEQGDRVLLHDAMAYGIMEYLEIFVPEQGEEEPNDHV